MKNELPLTEQEQRILDTLSAYIAEKGYAPSQRELARLVGLKSPNTVDYHLKKLEQKGYVKCSKNRFRAIELVRKAHSAVSRWVEEAGEALGTARLPVLGTVPAGAPALAQENWEDTMEFDPVLVKGPSFALRVKGNSMKDAGILPGDLVVVRVQPTAQDGDIVVARFEDEATVKYFRRSQKGLFLMPANDAYQPIPAEEAEIVGKVTGVVRKYS